MDSRNDSKQSGRLGRDSDAHRAACWVNEEPACDVGEDEVLKESRMEIKGTRPRRRVPVTDTVSTVPGRFAGTRPNEASGESRPHHPMGLGVDKSEVPVPETVLRFGM